MQDGGIEDDCIELKMAVSQFRINLVRVYVRLYGSINPIESVTLPSVNYYRCPKWRPFVVLCRNTALPP